MSANDSRWAISFTQNDGTIHVYPLFGSEHTFPGLCWCNPHEDSETDNLWIHEVNQ